MTPRTMVGWRIVWRGMWFVEDVRGVRSRVRRERIKLKGALMPRKNRPSIVALVGVRGYRL